MNEARIFEEAGVPNEDEEEARLFAAAFGCG
jgi:hypothetical protein